jgi:mRNA-decapping enzyme 1B
MAPTNKTKSSTPSRPSQTSPAESPSHAASAAAAAAAPHQQPIIVISDEVRKQANLRLLQRTIDSSIADIHFTATHVVMYEFLDNQWTKLNVEGSLFLTSSLSSTAALYRVIVLNRSSTENFVMPITADTQLQHQDPFIIFKERKSQQQSASPRILGVWIHGEHERDKLAAELESTIASLNLAFCQTQEAPAAPVPLDEPPPSAETASRVDSTAALAALLGVTSVGSAGPVNAAATPSSKSASSITPPRPPSASLLPPPLSASTTPPRPPTTLNPPPSVSRGSQQLFASPETSSSPPLDKKSLQLALLSLIQDDRFLDLVHSQYLRVVHARKKSSSPAPVPAAPSASSPPPPWTTSPAAQPLYAQQPLP